jgi:DNA-binding IclR family transcriptional regulator
MEEFSLARVDNPTTAEMPAGHTRSVPVLCRALSIMELLAETRNGLTLPEVARRLAIPKSSTHCILLTLLRQNYVTRSPRTRRFILGFKLFSLANEALNGLRLRELAMPHLRQLTLSTGLTVHMAIFERHEAILIAKIDPPGGAGLATWIGRHMELHCTGLGKVLLGSLSDSELTQLLQSRTFPRHNDNTIVSYKRLMQEISKVRANGYALDDEEEEIGVRCIGIPLYGSERTVAAAISVAGSLQQITNENIKSIVARLTRTAGYITEALKNDKDNG